MVTNTPIYLNENEEYEVGLLISDSLKLILIIDETCNYFVHNSSLTITILMKHDLMMILN